MSETRPDASTSLAVSAVHAAMMRKKLEGARSLREMSAAADQHSRFLLSRDRAALRELYAQRAALLRGESGD